MISEAAFFGGVMAGTLAGSFNMVPPRPHAWRFWSIKATGASAALRLPYTGELIGSDLSKVSHMMQTGLGVFTVLNEAGASFDLEIHNQNNDVIETLAAGELAIVSLLAFAPPYGSWQTVKGTYV